MHFLILSIFISKQIVKWKGVYGDILKVKIMYNRRDNALMQFKSCDQAMNGNFLLRINHGTMWQD